LCSSVVVHKKQRNVCSGVMSDTLVRCLMLCVAG